jgi:hypothetical protein
MSYPHLDRSTRSGTRETIGAAGKPPRDESYDFAAHALVVLVLSWIMIPFVVCLAITV